MGAGWRYSSRSTGTLNGKADSIPSSRRFISNPPTETTQPAVSDDNQYYSFAREGLVEDFEVDFLRLKLKDTPLPRGKPVKNSD